MNPRDSLPFYQMPGCELVKEGNQEVLRYLIEKVDELIPVLWSSNIGKLVIQDLDDYRNLIVVGPSLMGKTVFINQIILSLLYKFHPGELKLVLIDSRRNELGYYRLLERHFLVKATDENLAIAETPDQSLNTLEKLCLTMRERYDLFRQAGCKDIQHYNKRISNEEISSANGHFYMPLLVLVIDEVANVTIAGRSEIDGLLKQLVYEGGKTGIITILGTNQYGGGDVISADLLRGFQQRVAFRFNDRDDYKKYFDTVRVPVINHPGEFIYRELSKPVKGKSIYFSETEIMAVCEAISKQECFPDAYDLYSPKPVAIETGFDLSDRDPLLEDAARLVVTSQMGSTSLIQRRMKLGYNRAGRLMDQLEAAGVVGENRGVSARDVLIKNESELERMFSCVEEGVPFEPIKTVPAQTISVPNSLSEAADQHEEKPQWKPETSKRKKQSRPLWIIITFLIILWWLIKNC